MANEDVDSLSVSSSAEKGIPLFPRIRMPGLEAAKSDGLPVSRASTVLNSEFDNFEGLFPRNTTPSPNSSENNKYLDGSTDNNFDDTSSAESRQSKGHATLFPSPKKEKNEKNFDEGVDVSEARPCSSSTDDTDSFESRVIRAIGTQIAVGAIEDTTVRLSKFKYVDMYESALRTLDSNLSSSSSIFDLSSLDEYNKFLRMSELDQQIQNKLVENHISFDSNVLPVLDADDFHKLYNGQGMPPPRTPLKTKFKLKMPMFFGKKQKQVKPSSHEIESQNEEDSHQSPDSRVSTATSTSTSVGDRNQRPYLHRKLEVRHLQMISMGGTLGVGLYLNVGKAFTIAGGLGTVLAMLLVGLVVFATVVSFCEMVTFVSVVDGVSGLSSRFVDESFGFATGWLYFFSFAFGLAGEIVASVIILSYFPSLRLLTGAGSTAGFVTLFLLICIVCNISSVRVFGEVEYFTSLAKVIITLLGIVSMIVVNRGGIGDKGVIGFRYWDYSKSNFEHNIIFGTFRPTFNLLSDGMDSETEGIGGNLGRFLSLLVAVVVAAYAYSGTEIVCIAACEAKDPRKALPSATNKVFWRILFFYCLSSFVVSLNIYAGDPRLLRFYSGTTGVSPIQFDNNYVINFVGGNHCIKNTSVISSLGSGSQSPWIVAFQSAGSCTWSIVVNIFLFFFALSCGNSHLYVSSRTIYSLALQRKAPGFLRKCNRFGTPYFAVLASAIPALLAYTCVSSRATTVFQNLTSLISSSGVFVWFAMCLSFLRFYFGLKKRPDIISRDEKEYPYRSRLQPYSAIFGLFGSSIILLAMGFVVFLKGCWNTWFFFASYGTLMIFVVLYIGHRLIKGPSIVSLEALDYDTGRREKDIYIWDGGKEYNVRKFKDLAHKAMEWMA